MTIYGAFACPCVLVQSNPTSYDFWLCVAHARAYMYLGVTVLEAGLYALITARMSSTSSNSNNLQRSVRSPTRVILERNGKRVELNVTQVITENLRKMFQVCFDAWKENSLVSYAMMIISLQVHPSETWLRDECDGSVYFPDPEGNFNLEDNRITPCSTLVVEGPTASGLNMRMGFSPTTDPAAPGTSSSSFTTPRQSVLPQQQSVGPPMFRSVVAPKKAPVTLIKIMKAKMSVAKKGGKPDFQCTGQMYIELSLATANVGHVCEVVRKQWGSDYTVVSVEGLEIDDTSATQG